MNPAIPDKARIELDPYMDHVPAWVGERLRALARQFAGATVVHVNSTATGGGVAEILHRLVPLQRGLGLDSHWLVLKGDAEFYRTTKKLHNTLQGQRLRISDAEWDHYLEVQRENRESAADLLDRADFVIIHDPQPAAFLTLGPPPRGLWAWRCHIDLSRPERTVWRRLRPLLEPYRVSVYSLAAFSRRLPHHQVLIAPAIDPLTEKNRALTPEFVDEVCRMLEVPCGAPMFVQVSRFDRFKDPVGVIEAFKILRRHRAAHLVLAGGSADDDPEGQEVLAEVRQAAGDDDHIHILLLPPDAHLKINALQRAATVVVQKSLREGFGLTVTEALWKGKPVIGGAVGGITLQVLDGFTGHLVNTVEGCAYRMRQMLRHRGKAHQMGEQGIELVRGEYLITRQLRDHFMLFKLLRGEARSPLALMR